VSCRQFCFSPILSFDSEFGSRPNHPVDGPAFILPDPLPVPPKRVKLKLVSVTPPKPAAKRRADEAFGSAPEIASPSKKRRLEEEGLVLMDSEHDKLEDDDIIEIE
jgi:ubiquitin-like 1-activating enzyme E1 B